MQKYNKGGSPIGVDFVMYTGTNESNNSSTNQKCGCWPKRRTFTLTSNDSERLCSSGVNRRINK